MFWGKVIGLGFPILHNWTFFNGDIWLHWISQWMIFRQQVSHLLFTPKSSILMGVSLKTIHVWVPPFMETTYMGFLHGAGLERKTRAHPSMTPRCLFRIAVSLVGCILPHGTSWAARAYRSFRLLNPSHKLQHTKSMEMKSKGSGSFYLMRCKIESWHLTPSWLKI